MGRSLPGASMMMNWDRGCDKLVLHKGQPSTELSRVDVSKIKNVLILPVICINHRIPASIHLNRVVGIVLAAVEYLSLSIHWTRAIPLYI